MQVREISNRHINSFENNAITYFEEIKKIEKSGIDTLDIQLPYTNWQKNVLLEAIDRLDNNIQLDDIHPLDKKTAMPIESYEEALIELSYVKSNSFSKEAGPAQANISAKDIVHLFTES